MRRHFRSPLARYGFSALFVIAYAGDFYPGALVAGAIALYAWKIR